MGNDECAFSVQANMAKIGKKFIIYTYRQRGRKKMGKQYMRLHRGTRTRDTVPALALVVMIGIYFNDNEPPFCIRQGGRERERESPTRIWPMRSCGNDGPTTTGPPREWHMIKCTGHNGRDTGSNNPRRSDE